MPKNILLVEDDEDILDIIYYLLTDDGYHVERSLGQNVFTMVLEKKPDLVLMDHRLQTCFGGDICRQIKGDPRTCNIPVIMMSATMNLELTVMESGADAMLKKPFDMQDLLYAVRQAL